MPRASRREAAFAAAAYVLLAIAYWWPLPLRAADAAIAHPFGDPLLNAWTLAWDARHLLHGFSGYWDGLFFHPYPDTVAYSEHLLGIAVFTAPLQWFTGNAVLVLNVATIASTALAGFGMFLLARHLTGRADAALLAGVAFACAPYRLAHAYHLQVLLSGWMPIAFYGLHRYLARPTLGPMVVFVGAFVVQGLSNGYFLFFTAIPVVVIAIDGLWRAEHRASRFRGLALAAVAVVLAVLPAALAYMRVRREQGFTRTLADVATYSATPEAYTHVAARSIAWGAVLPPGREELQLFPGLLVVVLAVVAVAWACRASASDPGATPGSNERHHVWLYLGIVILMGVLSLGPQPVLFGWSLPVPGPYAWLVAVMPGLDGLRVPARMATVVYLGLSVLAAFGFAALVAPGRRAVGRIALLAGIGLLAAEGYGGPQPVEAFPTASMTEDAAAYAWLAEQPRGPLLELPVGDPALATRHLYRTLEHGHRIVNGYSGYGSILQDFVGGPPFTEVARIGEALAMARTVGIQWVKIHPPLYEHPSAGAAVADAIAASSDHVARVRRFGATVVAELRGPELPVPTARDEGSTELKPPAFTVDTTHNPADVGRMLDGDAATRWASGARQGSGETITIVLAEPADVAHLRLDLGARSPGDYPRGLLVESAMEGQPWQTLVSEDILPRLGLSLVREPRSPGIDVPLPSNRTQRLRLRTMGETRAWYWSIHELRIWVR